MTANRPAPKLASGGHGTRYVVFSAAIRPLAATEAVTETISKRLRKLPEVRSVFVDASVEARSQLGRVHLTPRPNAKVLVGTFARAEIDAGRDCGLVVPLSALIFGTEGPLIGLVQEDRVVMHAVKTGLLEGGQIEIRDGLSENDQVIARAAPFLREGDKVVAVPEGR